MSEEKSLAVFKTGGKQYTVSPGDKVRVEMLEGEAGQSIEFGEVLMVKNAGQGAVIGEPFIKGATIKAKILALTKDKKVIIYKKRRRKGYTKKQGHRQKRTEVLIEAING